jgi:SHS2 domain-containing protein
MSYSLQSHTADVAVEATAGTLGGVFAASADGMAAAMCEDVPAAGERFDLSVTAEGREALLFDYLDTLIYERDVRGVLPVDNEATVTSPDARTATEGDEPDSWHVSATARGVPLDRVAARDLKAVTYSEMEVEETADSWRVYVVFDV